MAKGFGFIKCDEAMRQYGGDVYVRAADLQDRQVGESVIFSMTEMTNGKPHGSQLELITTEVRHESTETGTVKSFSAAQGYGFISCAETFAKYGRDVFIHKDQLADAVVGDEVSFFVELNSAGHPKAHGLTKLRGRPETAKADLNSSGEPPLEVHTGFIKIVNQSKQCGFIECHVLHSRFERDVFFPLPLLPEARKGDAVQFNVRIRNGQPQATSLTVLDTQLHPNAAAEPRQAEIRTYDPEITKKLLRACASSQKDSYRRMFEMLHSGADPNGRDIAGQTALMVCALNVAESEKKCRLLVGMGADVHAGCNGGMTVLQWAKERVSTKFADHLAALARGEQIDCLISLDFMGGSEV